MKALWDRNLPGARRFKSAGGGTTQTNNEPWSGAKPFLTQGYQAAEKNILNNPTEFFPGSTVVPFAPESQAGMAATTQRALQGSEALGGANRYTSDVLSGKAFGPDSPLMYGINSAVRPGVDGQFAKAGRGGSQGHAEALSRGLASAMAPYMESAANRAPSLAREDYFDIDRLAGVGSAREGKAGEDLADQMARWDFSQNEPGQRAQSYNSTISGIPMPTSSTSRSSQNVNSGMWAAGTAMQALGK